MRSLVQRVSQASVTVDGQVVGAIGHGMRVLVGVEVGDTPADVARHVAKLAKLRMFEDAAGKMNLDIAQAQGGFWVVSQFTLAGDCRKGNRPGFDRANFHALLRNSCTGQSV
jgi:D-tyrosyl-tRNA(Tyr) deacylase